MKIASLAISIGLLCSGAVFGQGTFLSRLEFGLESYPEETGNSTHGYVSYRLSDTLSSSLLVKIANSSVTSAIPDTQKLLYLQNEKTNEFFVYPLNVRFELGDEPFSGGLGLYLSTQSLREVGYFDAGDPVGLNSYENEQRGSFFGPLMQAGYSWEFPHVQLFAEARLVPYFWYRSEQTITIDPLVPSTGSNSYRGSGFPYVYLRLNPRAFSILSPDVEYEYQRYRFESLEVGNDESNNVIWEKVTNTYDTHTLALRGNIFIPLRGGDQYIEFGYGQKLRWVIPAGKTPVYSAEGIFKLAYRFHK